MFGKVLIALGTTLWFATMTALGLWWATEKWGKDPMEWYADWRFVVIMTMGVAGWVFGHSMEILLGKKKSKEV